MQATELFFRSEDGLFRAYTVGNSIHAYAWILLREEEQNQPPTLVLQADFCCPFWQSGSGYEAHELLGETATEGVLRKAVLRWQKDYVRNCLMDNPDPFWFGKFNAEGQALASRLQTHWLRRWLVRYLPPVEDIFR